MTRKQLEKKIVTSISLWNGEYQMKKEETSNRSQHFYFFEIKKNNMTYEQILRFVRPHFICYDSTIYAHNEEIDKLILKIDPFIEIRRYYAGVPFFEKQSFSIFGLSLHHYMAPENANRRESFEWNKMFLADTCIRKENITIKDTPDITQDVVNTFFRPVIEEIIPKTDSLDKIDSFLNDLPELKKSGVEPPIVSAFYPYQQQIVMGLILANYLERADRKELTEKYLELASNYKEDASGYIDLLYKAADYFQCK